MTDDTLDPEDHADESLLDELSNGFASTHVYDI